MHRTCGFVSPCSESLVEMSVDLALQGKDLAQGWLRDSGARAMVTQSRVSLRI